MNKIETDRKEKVVHVMEISNEKLTEMAALDINCLLYTSPSPRDM